MARLIYTPIIYNIHSRPILQTACIWFAKCVAEWMLPIFTNIRNYTVVSMVVLCPHWLAIRVRDHEDRASRLLPGGYQMSAVQHTEQSRKEFSFGILQLQVLNKHGTSNTRWRPLCAFHPMPTFPCPTLLLSLKRIAPSDIIKCKIWSLKEVSGSWMVLSTVVVSFLSLITAQFLIAYGMPNQMGIIKG